MITHIIYHIPGRKVGCTKNLLKRIEFYRIDEGVIPDHEVLEELHDKTDQEAGDIEWDWADRLGYSRGPHYIESVKAANSIGSFVTMTKENRILAGQKGASRTHELGLGGFKTMTHQKRSEAGHKGGIRAGELGKSGLKFLSLEDRKKWAPLNGRKGGTRAAELGVGFHSMSPQRWSEVAQQGGYKGGVRVNELGTSGTQVRAACPHCGLESNRAILGRWHFDNCPKKPRGFVRRR
jgi:general stress protein YciG